MGVHNGENLCCSLANLTLGRVDSVARKRAEEAGMLMPYAPAVAFDISAVAVVLELLQQPLKMVMAKISIFLDNGFLLFPVFDPEWRH